MIWTGKIIFGAIGYLIGRLPGALIGVFIGHQLDKKATQLRAHNPFRPMPEGERAALNEALLEAIFSILGHLAKADGRVSEREIAQAEALMARMGLQGARRQQAINAFQRGKRADFPLDDEVARFRARSRHRKTVVLNFMEILLSASLADGHLHAAEEQILLRVAKGLGIPEAQFRQVLSMLLAQARFSRGGHGYAGHAGGQAAGRQRPRIDEAYAVLGVAATASDAEVKKAYRRLMSRHHPDKLASQGLSEEMIRAATDKSAEVSRAYDLIKEQRGFK